MVATRVVRARAPRRRRARGPRRDPRLSHRSRRHPEEIVELLPERRFSYVLLSGLAIRNYRADVDLEPTGRGTVLHWHSAFTAKVPGSGWLYRWQLARFIGQLVQGLAAHAEASSRSVRSISHETSRLHTLHDRWLAEAQSEAEASG